MSFQVNPNIQVGKSLFVGGEWVVGSGQLLVSTNPANGENNAKFATASESDVDRAVKAARDGLKQSGWAELQPHRRADHLHAIARLLADRTEELAQTAMCENGKTLAESRQQVRNAAGIFRYYASLCETLGSEVTPSRGDHLSFTLYEPWGVVAAITPWNSPVNLAAEKIAPALAAGNAIVLKPSEITSIVSLELGQLCADAGLPAGLVNIVPGTAIAANALVHHPGIDMISFTGGTKTGRAIAAVAADRVIPILLELGGKSANIVMDDADLDLAAPGVAAGIFGSMGQSCIAGSRLFVHESVRERLVARLVEIARGLRVGAPESDSSQLGPLASFAHRDFVHGMVRQAVEEGGRILVGGTPLEGNEFAKGAYYGPTIIDGLTNASGTAQNEIFGPVLCVLSFSEEADLVRQVNNTVYGLACGIWSRDFQKAWRIARRVQAGSIWVNTYRQNSVSTPFGGFKQSGLGRERGVQGLRQYQQVKSVFLGTSAVPLTFDR
jgi:betaine-aldehyde dehydrogenase